MTATLVDVDEAVGRIRSGDVIMVGGFGLVGAPLTLALGGLTSAGVGLLVLRRRG